MSPLPPHSEVVVIGAGVSGLSAAYFLAREGIQTTVIDRDPTASGASAQCIGTPWLGFLDTPWRLACAVGETKTTELLNLCQENSALARTLLPTQPVTWIWANHGTMVEDEWTPSLDVLWKNNVHASRFTSRDGTLRGIQLPEQWTIDPTDGLHTLEKHCKSHNVNICRGIPANDVSIDPLGTVVCTNRGTIRADAVVFAAGAWTGELLDGFSDKVMPVREHVHLGVHEGVKTPQVIRAQNGYIQWRSSASGWAISGARWATPHLEMGEQDTSQTPEPISTALNQFRAQLTEHCPDPQTVQRYLWAKTCDGLPIIGPVPGRSTWVCCTGFMGNDWGFGIRAGKAVADGLLSGIAPGIPDWLTATRFL